MEWVGPLVMTPPDRAMCRPHGGTTRSWVVPRKNGHLCRIAVPTTRVLPPDDAGPGTAPR